MSKNRIYLGDDLYMELDTPKGVRLVTNYPDGIVTKLVSIHPTVMENLIRAYQMLMEIKTPRFQFVSDDDGHWYMIPASVVDEFHRWVEYTGKDFQDEWAGVDFNQYRLGGGIQGFTFTDPQGNDA